MMAGWMVFKPPSLQWPVDILHWTRERLTSGSPLVGLGLR